MLAPYEVATKLEEISVKVCGPIAVMELLAEQDPSSRSSAMYMAVEGLESAMADLDGVVKELMDMHREQLKSKRS